MSKSKSTYQRPCDFGRVFFPDKTNPIPDVIYFQPLGNHVANVRKLIKAWKLDYFSGSNKQEKMQSKRRTNEGGRIHDIAKPAKFRIEGKTTKEGKFKEYIYSFKGHRFEARSSDKWAQMLAVGHHDYSISCIARDTYELKKHSPDYTDILNQDILAYARELYILEMCDQIEAELACRVIGDDEQAESRAFMDYTTAKQDEFTYLIDPYPFENMPIKLSFAYWSLKLTQEQKKELQKYLDSKQHNKLGTVLNEIVTSWWKSHQGKSEQTEKKLITLNPYKSENKICNWDCTTLYQKVTENKFIPNPMQIEVFDKITHHEQNPNIAFLLKAPTGSGKFESVVFPTLAKGYRLILPLPARSLIEDQKQRAEKYLKQFSKLHPQREFSLVIDTGSQMYRQVYCNGEEQKYRTNNPRRHLYKGDIILTTLDKFLYRYFAFGDKQKSFVFPLRINQDKTLICFDEPHSYDEIAFTNFQGLVQSLYEAGRSIVLMTATMPEEYVNRLNYLEVIDYIDDSENVKKLTEFQHNHLNQPYLNQRAFEWINDIERDFQNPEPFQERIEQILEKESQNKYQSRIITVVQTVKDAVAIYQSLKDNFGFTSNTQGKETQIFLYHGRLDKIVREEVYKNLKERDENNLPYILITTSAIEVGCDLNSEILISEICLPENLIQRVGRCNRKGNIPDAKVVLVGNIDGDRIPFYAQSLDEAGWQKYQEKLANLSDFDAQIIGECISREYHVDDYRVVELFSMLHDYVYGADLTCQPIHEKGLVVTRSWTPSATLVYDDGNNKEIKDMPQISVPVDRLIIKKDEDSNEINKYVSTYACERYYDQNETRWKTRDLGWGCAYQKDIIIKIGSNSDGAFIVEDGEKYEYNPELGFVDLPGIFIKWRSKDFEEKLQYKYDKQKSAVITYVKALESN